MDYGSGNWIQRMSGITPSSDWVMCVAMAENDTSTAYLAGAHAQRSNIMKTSTVVFWSTIQTPTIRTFKRAGADKAEIMAGVFRECPLALQSARIIPPKVTSEIILCS